MVEHLLAKEDVASSSLVTRSSLGLGGGAKRRLERSAEAFGEGGRPWILIAYFAFQQEKTAIAFEKYKYLKSGSGRAFAKLLEQ